MHDQPLGKESRDVQVPAGEENISKTTPLPVKPLVMGPSENVLWSHVTISVRGPHLRCAAAGTTQAAASKPTINTRTKRRTTPSVSAKKDFAIRVHASPPIP